MARQIAKKTVRASPTACCFMACAVAPQGEVAITLLIEEWESMRLVDYLGLDQAGAASSMGVSRQTVQSLLQAARQKTARALVEGVALTIQGGAYVKAPNLNHHSNRSKKMKIAVTCEGNTVFQHFGRTPEFCVYTIEDGKASGVEKLQAPAEGHGALVGFLKEHGINALICGGIGGGAVNRLREAGIAVFAGASGDVEQQVSSYLSGQLQANDGAGCGHHDHDHGCGGHHDHDHGCGEHHGEGGHGCGEHGEHKHQGGCHDQQ